MIVYAGDSWALKGFTPQNYFVGNNDPVPGDVRMADHWSIPYRNCLAPGRGNLSVLDKLCLMKIDPEIPVIWVYTEPGRDYGRITGRSEHDWMTREDIFDIRRELDKSILDIMRDRIKNPIGLIGGLSDINVEHAKELRFEILHPSWQAWIAQRVNSQYFRFGWGASDIGWRANHHNVIPSKTATFAWDEQIKEWCWWEELGYFCHEHPTPLANQEFAEYLQPKVEQWLAKHEK